MSGHSKWAQIKRQKGAADVKRGALYTKLGHALALAVREGGRDPAMNVKLRLALERARAANMPNTTVERAIQRGAGELAGQAPPEQIVYEGYGPGGTALLVQTLTDNKNRTASELRHLFAEHGGTLAGAGSVQWMFTPRGVVRMQETTLTPEQELACIDAGTDDVQAQEDGVVLFCAPAAMDVVRRVAEKAGLSVVSAEVESVPSTAAPEPSDNDARRFFGLVAALEENDDVVKVITNVPH